MQYKQRALVIFPLLHGPEVSCAWNGPDTTLGPDLPAVEVITNFLAQ